MPCLANIRIRSALPLHPYLIDNPALCVRLLVGSEARKTTPFVKGNSESGIWKTNSTFELHETDQMVTLAIVANERNREKEFALTRLSVPRLLASMKTDPNEDREFIISNELLELSVDCSIKMLATPMREGTSSQADTHESDAIETFGESKTSNPGQNKSALPSQKGLIPQDANPVRLYNLWGRADAFCHQFAQRGDPADIDKAISHYQDALATINNDRPEKRTLYNSLGTALRTRFERLGNLADVDNALLNQQRAVGLTPDDHPEMPGQLNNLGNSLKRRFERLGSLADIDNAISLHQKAVEITPDSHFDRPGHLNSLGASLTRRFERLGNLPDINAAISIQQMAAELTPDGHTDRPGYLSSLGASLSRRFERLGSLVDVDRAILSLQKAVELTPDGHPNKPNQLHGLGVSLLLRFDHLGRLSDIDTAISNQQRAVELTLDDHPNKSGILGGLGSSLMRRFERLGSLVDMDNAISSLQKAVELTPDGHPNKPNQLQYLGISLRIRFGHLGSLPDVNAAISSQQTAVELTPDGHPNKPFLYHSLGNSLQTRFERLGSLEDIEKATSVHQMAVELTPDNHLDKPDGLNSLGTALQAHALSVGDHAGLDNAISYLQKAIELTPNGHPDKPSRLNNLGTSLQTRFQRLGHLIDIKNAISSLQNVVELTPDGHPDLPIYLYNLGNSHIASFDYLHILENLESALQSYSKAARSPSGSATVRFKAARAWARYSANNSRSPLTALSCAIDLLPQIAWPGLTVNDQHALLAGVGDIVPEAVAAAIEAGKYEDAIEWAEQGRSIVWQNLLGLRPPLDGLQAIAPQLAARLQRVAQQLEVSSPSDGASGKLGAVFVANLAYGYSKLATEWEEIIDEIRKMPSFEGFLKPKRFATLAPAAYEGPVVIFNAHHSRCDALVLRSENMQVTVVNVPLEGFSYNTAQRIFQEMKFLVTSAELRPRSTRKHQWVSPDVEVKFKTILRILWLHMVKPVLERLDFQTKSGNPPRIWWCATGFLSFLPIHAAGLYGAGETGENALDYVVSSYTPTLTAILNRGKPMAQDDFQLLTVAQPSTPYATAIPKTDEEVKLVQSIANGVRVVNLLSEDATVERVVECMKESNWIHLACHGQQDTTDIMKSGFLLHDNILELASIVKLTLPKTDFAFLSACQTATGDERVAEESAHLAAGMLLSGCRGVIATMWSIRDDDGPKVAGDVYSRMLEDGRPNREQAAYALHEAVRRLRASGAGIMAWVPFIHIGR